MPFSSPNETVLHYERSGAGEALVLEHGSWVGGGTRNTVRITHHDSYIEALEAFATGVTHG
jgi:hypothetical protein